MLSPEEYVKLMRDSITSDYKLDRSNLLDKTNKEAAEITEKLDIAERVQEFIKSEPKITLKDHKEDWPGKVEVRLINPAKS